MINAHSHINWPEIEFWVESNWRYNHYTHGQYITFSLLCYTQNLVATEKGEYTDYRLTIFNFQFIWRVQQRRY